MSAGFHWSEAFIRQLEDKEFRDEFVTDQVRTKLALQIRALREQAERKWSQTELAERMGTTQSVVSRIEDSDYGKLSLQTLLEVAAAFDLPLNVEFGNWPDWIKSTRRMSFAELERLGFNPDALLPVADEPHSSGDASILPKTPPLGTGEEFKIGVSSV